jgi:hypothetical protein
MPTPDQQTPAAEEQSEDQAGAEESGVEESVDDTEHEESGSDDEGDEEVQLLTKEQVESLKGDPEKLMKELNRAATKKFQETAAVRKNLEAYSGFIKAVEEDPVAAVTAVAKRLGIKLADNATEKQVENAVNTLGDKITGAIRQSLGDDYGDLADKIGLGVHEALKLAIPELTKDTNARIDEVVNSSALRESEVTLEAFTKKNPDWKNFEAEMTALAEKLPPGKGVTEMEYLDFLYTLASRDGKAGDGVKKVIKKMQKSASSSNNDGTTVGADKVSKAPGRPPTFAEAAAAARRGERFE